MASVIGDILTGFFRIIGKLVLLLMWGVLRLLELICHSLARLIKNILSPKER